MGRPIMSRLYWIIAPVMLLLVLFGFLWNRRDTLAKLWLYRSCGQTGQAALEAEVRQFAVLLEPIFVAAYENGPSPQIDESAGIAVDREIQLIKSLTADDAALTRNEIGQEEAMALRRLTQNSQARRERAKLQFLQNYRSAAVSGLGLTHGESGRRLLEELSRNSNSPFQRVAQLSLAKRYRLYSDKNR